IGCYGCISGRYLGGRQVAKARGRDEFTHQAICTNIDEKDTIYGGVEKLKNTIREANIRYDPKIIYVTTSCASSIVGDDVQSVADEMSNELGKKVIAMECEGFKSKVWSTGFDVGHNAVLRSAVEPPKKKQMDLVNIFNFSGSDTFTPFLGLLGLRPNYLTEQSTLPQLAEISEAACSASICETLATYPAKKLEELYGVPQIKAPAPYGIEWCDSWLREIASVCGKEDIVEEVIESEHKRIEPELKELREFFKGKKVYIFSGCSYAHNMASVCRDLGLDIIGITTYHHDQEYDNPDISSIDDLVDTIGDIPNYTICNKQPYQVIKFLKNLNPDFLIVRHESLTVLGYKLGIPSIMEGDSNKCVGYEGVLDLGRRIKTILQTRKLFKNYADHVEFPYTDWWMKDDTDPFYFVSE
ncbi:MAG: nitrogenase, partial [Lachnospiraceae bacterium]|nr:nitrogenase [Lachnospiraceae bacterium]